jgi:hypothetical protein
MGVQGVATRFLVKEADPRWILLGCLLPDVPWILLRIALGSASWVDPYDAKLYAIVQASFAFCLMLSGALALVSAKPRKVFGILALNALMHLLLDALEVKWGSGVHLLAPFSWKMTNFGLFWTESLPSLLLTGLGLGFATWCWVRRVGPRIPLTWGTPAQRAGAACLLLGYLIGPVFLRAYPERTDNHFMATLKDRSQRPGRYVEFDRGRIMRSGSGTSLKFFSGESLRIEGDSAGETGLASVRARFVDESTLRVFEMHRHPAGLRDAATYVGIALIGLIWLPGAGFTASGPGRRERSGLASGA